MFTAILFTAYTLLLCWLITSLPFFKKSGIGRKWLVALFLLKIAAGCFYGYVHTLSVYYPDKIDTWRFYFQSLPETELLKKDPAAFWQSLFGNGYEQGGGILSNVNSYWNDLKHNIMLLLMSLFNLLSRGNYYINVIFYNFLAFAGLVALYRVFNTLFPGKNRVVLICVFLIPTVVFWGSGFHKEGLLLSALGGIFYQVFQMVHKRVSVYRLLVTSVLLLMIFLLRPYVLFALLPALTGWVMGERTKWKPAYVFGAMYAGVFLFFFLSSSITPKINLPAAISNAQHDFLALGGNTTVVTDSLQPTATGFLQYLPHALDIAFFRPRLFEGGITYLPSAFENIVLLALFLLFLLYRQKEKNQRYLLYALAGYSVCLLLLIGYSVPVTGAVIRYKVLATPFLALFFALQTDWKRAGNRRRINND